MTDAERAYTSVVNPTINTIPDAQCMVYLPTFTPQNYPNVVLKRPYIEHLGSVLMALETFMKSYTLLLQNRGGILPGLTHHEQKTHQHCDFETAIFFWKPRGSP